MAGRKINSSLANIMEVNMFITHNQSTDSRRLVAIYDLFILMLF
jgi:hypothetical protein